MAMNGAGMHAASMHVDLKSLGKPTQFSGLEEDWPEWSFVMRAYIGMMNIMDARLMERVEANTGELRTAAMDEEMLSRSNMLWYALTMLVKGKALMLIKRVEANNGLEAWRCLVHYYDRGDAVSSTGLLQCLLEFKMGDRMEVFAERIMEFDLLLQRYNRHCSPDELPEAVCRALIVRGAPEPLKSHLQLTGQSLSYVQFRNAIEDFLLAKKAWKPPVLVPTAGSSAGTGVHPMEVDYVNQKGGKGFQPKGKGKGQQTDYFAGECRYCGHYGHKVKTCRKKQFDQQQRSKGKGKGQQQPKGKGKGQQQTKGFSGGKAKGKGKGVNEVHVVEQEQAPEQDLQLLSGLALPTDECEEIEEQGHWIYMLDSSRSLDYPCPSSTSTSVMRSRRVNWRNPCSLPLFAMGCLFRLFVDSAAFDCVCPPRFARHVQVEPYTLQGVESAEGRPMQCFGRRMVPLKLVDDKHEWHVVVPFVVMNVMRPLLSVNRLISMGFGVSLSEAWSALTQGEDALRLDRIGAMFTVWAGFDMEVEMEQVQFPPRSDGWRSGSGPGRSEIAAIGDEVEGIDGAPGDLDDGDSEQLEGQARVSTALPQPNQPSDAERASHELTHMPFRDWCEACVRGRGKESHHRPRTEIAPEVRIAQLDYFFPGALKGLAVVDANTGFGASTVVQTKGGSDLYSVSFVDHFMDELGCGDCVIQTDPEPAAQDLARSVVSRRKHRVEVRTTPRGSHSSNGGVERFIQSVEAVSRTLGAHVSLRYRVALPDCHPVLVWAIRHAGFLHTRFQVHTSGKTSFEQLKGHKYTSEMLEYGESVLAKKGRQDENKLRTDWSTGIWVGRAASSNEHLIITPEGLLKCRTVHRRSPSLKYEADLLQQMTAVPWQIGATQRELREGARALAQGERTVPTASSTAIAEGLSASSVPIPAQAEIPETPRSGARKRAAADSRQVAKKAKQFKEEFGATVGCRGCIGERGMHHTVACKSRRSEWERRQGGELLDGDEATQARGMTEVIPEPMQVESQDDESHGRKRGREEAQQIEVQTGGSSSSRSISVPEGDYEEEREAQRRRVMALTSKRLTLEEIQRDLPTVDEKALVPPSLLDFGDIDEKELG